MKHLWIAGGVAALAALALAAVTTWTGPGGTGTPPVGAGLPGSETLGPIVDQTAEAPLERVLSDAPQVYYQYVDDAGNVRFVPHPMDAPPHLRAELGRVELASKPPSTPAEARMLRKLRKGDAGSE